jgi:hypothetical protein
MLGTLSKIQSNDQTLNQIQDLNIRTLNPVLQNQLLQGQLLQNQKLSSGANTINHKLGRNLIGWFLTRIRANAQVWDTQDSNSSPGQTLILNASTAVTVDLWVF